MRLLVCGDRNWKDFGLIKDEVEEMNPTILIHGACQGADLLAAAAAEDLDIPTLAFPARWDLYGRAAGPIRNQLMLDEGKPDIVLAFHDDLASSKGTKDMLNRARKAGLKYRLVSHG